MQKYLLSCCAVALLATPATAEPWARGYVVTGYEPAWYFGGNASFHKDGMIEPGSDCPKGSFGDLDYKTVLLTPWRDAKTVEAINNPQTNDPNARLTLQNFALTYRGFRDGIDVYINPFAAPDPGMQQVTGKIAEGFDLDDNAKTGGFSSPSGRKGIDNALYRAWGCLSIYRDIPYHAAMSTRANDKMVEGLFTIVIRVSGNKDPLNDDDATVEVGFSPDKMIKAQGSSAILPDYSFRIANNGEYSKFKAVVKNGVVEADHVNELHMPRIAWFPNQYGDADFRNAKLRLETDADGNISGLVGGYRDWRDVFAEDHFAQTGSTVEYRDHQNAMAMYYALKRNADGLPDPKSGKNMGISTAYRILAKPAFVVTPQVQSTRRVTTSPTIEKDITSFKALHTSFYKALETRAIQPVPAGAGDEGFINEVRQLPDEVIKEAKFSLPPATTAPAAPPPPVKPAAPALKPGEKDPRQVRNGDPAIVASTATK